MRVFSTLEFDGVEYQALWASLARIDPSFGSSASMALAVRSGDGTNLAVIHRNAKLAEVESSLDDLRGLGLGEQQLARLFKFRGKGSGLAQHV